MVISHSHQDHSLALEDLHNMGLKVWLASEDKANIKAFQMGTFKVIPFELPHDGTKNHGFLIQADGQKVLYMTDFEYCPYVFKKNKINHMIVECNYQTKRVNRDMVNYDHKLRGHCSLETLIEFLNQSASDATRTVLLTHMGEQSCDPEECVAEVQKVLQNSRIEYARKGLELELQDSLCPF